MDLEAINRMGFGLYRDPELAIPMRDALEDLGITWEKWLERSGTLGISPRAWSWPAMAHP